jgi:hypothetical protein
VSAAGVQTTVWERPPEQVVQAWQELSEARPKVPWQQFWCTARLAGRVANITETNCMRQKFQFKITWLLCARNRRPRAADQSTTRSAASSGVGSLLNTSAASRPCRPGTPCAPRARYRCIAVKRCNEKQYLRQQMLVMEYTSPEQNAPPQLGGGFVQSRVRLSPVPQVALHGPHED